MRRLKSARADVICHKRKLYYYYGRPFALSLKAEEAATMFAVLLDTVHVSKPVHMTLKNVCKYEIRRFKKCIIIIVLY